jgi:hypothetical protein
MGAREIESIFSRKGKNLPGARLAPLKAWNRPYMRPDLVESWRLTK